MPKADTFDSDWIISLIAQQIAADTMIQQAAVDKKNEHLLSEVLWRTQLHTRLLQLVVQLRQAEFQAGEPSADLEKLLIAVKNSAEDLVKIVLEPGKLKLAIIGSEYVLATCLRIVALLVLLEDKKVKSLVLNKRRRQNYVSVKFRGGRITQPSLLSRELLDFVDQVLGYYGGTVDWQGSYGRRLVYIRLNLSNQLNLIE